MAIRMSLGAGRWRLRAAAPDRKHAAGARRRRVVGLLLASVTWSCSSRWPGQFTTRAQEISLNGTVLLFTLGIATRPACWSAPSPRCRAAPACRRRFRKADATVSAGRGSLRSALIVAQVAVSFVLLIGAGLMLRSVLRLQSVDAGIRTDSVLSMRVALNFTKYHDAGAPRPVPDRACRSSARPARRPIGRRRRDVSDERRRRVPHRRAASKGSRKSKRRGCRVRRCRRRRRAISRPSAFRSCGDACFDDRDIAEREPVAVISDSMARQFFPNADAVGARISTDNGRTWLRDRRHRRRRPQHARVAAVADVLSSARAGAAPDGHVPGAHVRQSRRARPADARRRARDRRAPARRSVPDARRGARGVAVRAAADGDAHRRSLPASRSSSRPPASPA